jgi:exonuclease III
MSGHNFMWQNTENRTREKAAKMGRKKKALGRPDIEIHYSYTIYVNTSNPLKVCHQNIRGLFGKTQEVLCFLLSDPPHIICLTEHHLKEYEVNNILIDNYDSGARYCRTVHKNGGVCIFIHNSIKFDNILFEKYCIEKDMEVYDCKLIYTNIRIMVVTVYRSPTGNFDIFLQKLHNILSVHYSNKVEFIICGDVNINYLEKRDRRQQLDSLLRGYL